MTKTAADQSSKRDFRRTIGSAVVSVCGSKWRATCLLTWPGQVENEYSKPYSRRPLEDCPPPRHVDRPINAEDNDAHDGEGCSQELHETTIPFHVSGYRQAESAKESVESRQGPGKVLHNRAGRHLTESEPTMRDCHAGKGHEYSDQSEQCGHA